MTSIGIVLTETRQSWRGLLRRPGYLALAALTLALGVATVTVIFSMLNQAVLRPLPFPEPDRLVTIGFELEPGRTGISQHDAALIRERMQGVESSGLVMSWLINANVAFAGRAEVARALHADQGLLPTLGLPLAAGRNFNDDEQRVGGPQAVLLSHAFWSTRFAADPNVIGTHLHVEGRAVPVIGVLPAAFQWPDPFDVVLNFQPNQTNGDINQTLIARLAPGIAPSAAAAQANSILSDEYQRNAAGSPARGERIRDFLRTSPPTALALESSLYTRHAGNTLWLFLAAAGCVLLIAAVNLASLMGLRTLARSQDSAVRMALGASAFRLSVPALAEGVLIGLGGSALGLLLAWFGLRALSGLVPPEWMRGEALHLSGLTPVFALFAGVLTALLAAALGLLRARQRQWARELVSGGRSGLSRQSGRVSQALVISQIALATVLLIGAALFARSLQELQAVPMGFHSERISTFTLSLVKHRHPDVDAAMTQFDRILDSLRRVPGVTAAGAASNLPTASQLNVGILMPDDSTHTVQYRLISPEVLDIFGIPLMTGRGLSERDVAGSEGVGVVSAAFAREYLHGEALGKTVFLPLGEGLRIPIRVVGVVGDVRQFGPAQPAPPVLYVPLKQTPAPLWAMLREFGPLSFAVRLGSDATGAVEGRLRQAVAAVDPEQPIANVQSMRTVVASTTAVQRMSLLVVGVFSALALLLAAVGLYAVMAVAVTARRHEFGVYAALGAPPMRLLRQVLLESTKQVALGLLIGLAAALALAQVLHGFLFGISTADPTALALTLLTLAAAGLIASLVPALRAARVEPAQVLRVE